MNRFIGIGRLAKDPEVKYAIKDSQNATCVARYTLAIDRKIKTDKGQNADFISCVAFGKTGEFAEKYLKKGMKIAVTGRIQTGSFEGSDGKKVYTTDVVVEEHEFVEKKSDSGVPEVQEGFSIEVDDADIPFAPVSR